jgi:D-beta-D-heptose 7-phosphate kinase/D-beta-D-heptose 1-phosphate adenosyltransferase
MKEIIGRLKKSKPKIAVFGDIILDHYLFGTTERISPEAPVPVFEVKNETYVLGGAGNVANNLANFGADVSLFSVVGNDENSEIVINMLKQLSIISSGVVKDRSRKTTIKSRIVSKSQQIIRFDKEDKHLISEQVESLILEEFKRKIHHFDIVLISDYAKGLISPTLSQNIINISNMYKLKVLIDPKGTDYSKYKNAYLIKPNRQEAIISLNEDLEIDEIGKKLIKSYNFENVIITLSENGMKLFKNSDEIQKFPTKAKDIFDVTGAGDTVLSALGFGIASGISLEASVNFANSSTAVVIGKIGTSTVSFDEILEYDKKENLEFGGSKLKSWEELQEIVKNSNRKVVFTNGCFDILHIGHIKYLEKAKSFGDILVVGLNSDSSVKKLKGDNRPINEENDRAYLLAGLQSVDYITIFTEETPYELIKTLSPDILVKGGDYEGKVVVGSDIVDEVKLVDFVDGKSTTNIIKKAKGENFETPTLC